MGISPFEDVFPIENGDFPVSQVKFAGVFCSFERRFRFRFPPPGKTLRHSPEQAIPTNWMHSKHQERRKRSCTCEPKQRWEPICLKKKVFLVELVGTQKLNFLKNRSFSNLIEYKKNQHHLSKKSRPWSHLLKSWKIVGKSWSPWLCLWTLVLYQVLGTLHQAWSQNPWPAERSDVNPHIQLREKCPSHQGEE